MIIQAIDGEKIECTWFDKATRKIEVFHPKTIEDADILQKVLARIEDALKKHST